MEHVFSISYVLGALTASVFWLLAIIFSDGLRNWASKKDQRITLDDDLYDAWQSFKKEKSDA